MSGITTRSLALGHGALEHTLSVPTGLYLTASQLAASFAKEQVAPTEGYASDEEPASSAELLAKFVGHVAAQAGAGGEVAAVLELALDEFEASYMCGEEVHRVAARLLADDEQPTALPKVKELVQHYVYGSVRAQRPLMHRRPALLESATRGDARVVAVFGGQGNTDDYFEELRELHQMYGVLVEDVLDTAAEQLNELLRTTEGAEKMYTQGLDFRQWLAQPERTPDNDYLLLIPISCPLIGILQLAHYAVTARIVGITPGELRACMVGVTGHSQGLSTAVAVAEADTWESFFCALRKTVSLLFFIGVRCYQVYPKTSLPPSILEDSLENGEGKPSPMLSVSNLTQEQVQEFVEKTNAHLPSEKHIVISLVNGARNLVVSGPPQSLYGLNLALRRAKAPAGLDQSRIPHSERKLKFTNRFLPIESPFHSHLLEPALELIKQDLHDADLEFKQESLAIAVYDTYDGHDLRQHSGSIVERIASCITKLPVYWETATTFKSTHILDYGPGGASGLGVLTHRNKDGTGVRVIIAGALDHNIDDEYGFKQELFDVNPTSLKFASNWLEEFHPKLIKTGSGKVYVDTKFSRLLGRPPLLVPGMTPTTVSPDFVAATINSGYHIELAGGGYFSPQGMTEAIDSVVAQIKKGSSLGINLIYVNPRMLQWGIPLIKELRSKGYPIQSLTIGAGVPSLEVASEYIETLGMTHLGLKPGSVDAISQVITIAKAHPTFPIVVQWTAGRGGGHHSFENFHAPMLQMYGKLRRHSNIILIAGSGFGSSEETYPYLTGEWSTRFNYPPMPFDGFLFGSRVMVAKEAKTSLAAKKAIAACTGVPDELWEQTYKKPTGGIVTVRSEMGEPIHKIATRGVMLWKELDETIFNLPKNKLQPALDAKRDYIIQKLNSDFQKPWFATVNGEARELTDMTYKEVAERMVELMFIKSTGKWIDVTLRNFTGDFLRRVEERFTKDKSVSVLQSYSDLETPSKVLADIFSAYPAAKSQFVNAQDVAYFLECAQRPTQKPVPFIPVLDHRFEFFFKKDSLWQSENLEAVVDEDVQRTCILHGPVAAQYTKEINEPIQHILDSIHDGHINKLLKDYYSDDISKVPVVEYFGGENPREVDYPTVKKTPDTIVYNATSATDFRTWFNVLAGSQKSWRHAFFSIPRVVQGSRYSENPTFKVFKPCDNMVVTIKHPETPDKTEVILQEPVQGTLKTTATVTFSGDVIQLSMIENRTMDGIPVALPLLYKYNPTDGFAPIVEIMEDRNQRIKEMYWKLWLKDPFNLDFDPRDPIESEDFTITSKDIAAFTHAIGNNCEDFVTRPGRPLLAPMDFAIVIGWRALVKAIFPNNVDGDLLNLVHLSNSYRMIPGAKPLQENDVVNVSALIKSVVNQENGKLVEVVGTIKKSGKPVIEVTTSFLYRGKYSDFENTFQKSTDPVYVIQINSPKDIAVLKSKEWLHFDNDKIDLLGRTLTFETETEVTFKNRTVFSSVHCEGRVLMELSTKENVQIGVVKYDAGESHGNPVIDYLSRNGSTLEHKVNLENTIPIATIEAQSPGTNETYARVSGDLNPIHVSRHFANYADLPGTITHGMYTSGAVRALVETWAADSVSSRVRAYSCQFVGMVLPNTLLTTRIEHVGMINGRKLIKFETRNDKDEPVLAGEAEVQQPVSTFVFTGQGSQEQGMGMDLYDKSPVARQVWDRADNHFKQTYGFSILEIVRTNPKELTIYFGGEKGRKIKENYTSMIFETIVDGEIASERIFKSITESSTSYTFKSDTGLLSATQFTQPALTLMEKASFEDLKSKGLIPAEATFAGHSLGEYAALASLADVMSIESLVEVVFYRGMTMQVAVPRDSEGRSNYGMIAVNPSRVSTGFTQEALQFVVERVGKITEWLVEIVNYNVEDQQYVAAGDLRALDTLTNVLNFVKLQKIDLVKLQATMPLEQVEEHLDEIITEISKKSLSKPQPIELERGFACIPLRGISVPFHSSYLRNGVKPFKNFLKKNIIKENVKVDRLIGKYIPNLTAKPFAITKEYFEDVYKLTGSEKIKAVLDNWESYQN
ncbi:AER085Cp [Eremothecium gossypii ATCC 10895]|uniref:Fatty acid synthase subunit beta n=1 Tax=Eremothecium gossypii (strain ATCC 10895 / CBS 109.51 / FGSC 9923 / NRRL Y-1056) TaxID=284811 RepID=Q757C8_EREGS|nr:AER085Cp [Eremothecium gossypii ATCC 10895]AAS52769.2 AER085Cp [Eremothecium gossypii ATCC 10895]AEY97075.1 FAER085Cp [Eremothecium gossypii FDAG1]